MGRMNRRRDRWLKRGFEVGLRPFIRRPRMDLGQIRAEDPRRILIVRQHNQMGDMLCAVPALRAIRQTFHDAHTMLVTAPINDGVVRNNPYIDEILLFDKQLLRRSPSSAWSFLRRLRGFRPDLAIVLNSVSFSSTSAWLAFLSGARRIMGGSSLPFGWTFSTWLYNLELPAQLEIDGHAIDHGLRPLERIGIRTNDRSTLIVPEPQAVARARRLLESMGGSRWAAVHPGAGKAENRWPPERFARAIEWLEARDLRVYLIEGPADVDATAQTFAALGRELPVLRRLDVQTVAAALSASDVALVNDTGIMHVAGAVGVPTVALFGPTPSEQWKPPSPTLLALQSPDGTMAGIELEDVLRALESRVERTDSFHR